MVPIAIWVAGITASIAMMVAAVAYELKLLHFSLSFIIVGFIALAGLRDQRLLQDLGAYKSHVSATMIRHMGVIYGWSAVMIAVFYMLLLDWQPWFGAFVVVSTGATLCLFLSNITMRDLTEAASDQRIPALIQSLAKLQFVVCCLSIGGLMLLGSTSDRSSDAWACINVLLASMIGIGSLSAYVVAFPTGFDFGDETDHPPAAVPPGGDRRKRNLGAPAGGDRRKRPRPFGKAKTA